MISYDLDSSEQKYTDLKECIETQISIKWYHYQESLYIVRSSLTPYEIMKKLEPFIDPNDSIIVTEIANNWSGFITVKEDEWINKNIFTD